jgi:hypothetical protein
MILLRSIVFAVFSMIAVHWVGTYQTRHPIAPKPPRAIVQLDILSVYEYRGLRIHLARDTALSTINAFNLDAAEEVKEAIDAYARGKIVTRVPVINAPARVARICVKLGDSLFIMYASEPADEIVGKTNDRIKSPW